MAEPQNTSQRRKAEKIILDHHYHICFSVFFVKDWGEEREGSRIEYEKGESIPYQRRTQITIISCEDDEKKVGMYLVSCPTR